MIKTFKTKNGRNVIDGRGIEPDVTVKDKDFSRLTAMIVSKNFIFNYATEFAFKNPSISSADNFTMTDQQYADFKNVVLKDTFDYTTASEEVLKKMKKTVEEEGYFEDAKSEYDALFKKLTPSKERDLEKFKPEIKQILENEIISRYHYQKGRTVHNLKNDDYLKKSIEILSNSSMMNTILKK